MPNDITWLLLLRRLQTFLSLYHRQFLFLERGLLPDEAEHVSGAILYHDGKIIHPMLRDGLLLGVVLNGKHLTDYRLLKDLNRLQIRAYLLQPTSLHLL